MNWRLAWYKATHHVIKRDAWYLIVGSDFNNSDYGVTFCRGRLPPREDWLREYLRWRVEWRINVHWPITIRRKVNK